MALAGIGLRLDDFLSLTPEEFQAIIDVWRQNKEAEQRDNWQRTRLMAAFSVMPHSKKIRKPEDLFTFPWERSEVEPAQKLSKEERRKRADALLKKWNNG